MLNLLLIQEIGAELESQWEFVTEDLAIAFNLNCVAVLQLTQSLCILLLGL